MASIAKRPNGRWRARYRDLDGREHARHFDRKVDAQRWLDTVTADLMTGRYVDPRAGRTTLRVFGERWLAAQVFDVTTRANVTSRLKVHVFPHLGDLELRAIRPSTVQAWVRGRVQAGCAPSHVRVMLTNLSTILAAAVADGMIATNPCASPAVKAPRAERRKVEPWTVEQVRAIAAAHPDRYRAVVALAAGCGHRQGELFGIAVDDVDFLRRTVRVRQQLKLVKGHPVLSPPKGGRERTVPLPDTVAVALAEHLREHHAVEVTVPWGDLDGPARTTPLLFTTPAGAPVNRNRYNDDVWKPALRTAGVEPSRHTGMHQLRHHYASVLLDGGVSIRAVAQYLGHADPGFTLRVYAHLMPDTEDRARAAIDAAHAAAADPVRTGRAARS
jgi:integrase